MVPLLTILVFWSSLMQHTPKKRKSYPWGVEGPGDRKKRLEAILLLPEDVRRHGRGLTKDEARSQLTQVEEYIRANTRKKKQFLRKTPLGQKARVTTAIYKLVDPRDNAVRYIGKTEQKLSDRLSQHISEANHKRNWKSNWIKNILSDRLKPKIIEIEVVPLGGDWVEAEQRWITYYKLAGARLTNEGDGGEGNSGYTHTSKTRKRLSETTSKHMNRPEIKEKHALGMSQFTKAEIISILESVAKGEKQAVIASKFNVHQGYISRLVTGYCFSHIEELEDLRQEAQKDIFTRTRKLSVEKIVEILEKYVAAKGKISLRELGEDYGVKDKSINDIIHERTWKGKVDRDLIKQARHTAKFFSRQQPSERRKLSLTDARLIRELWSEGTSVRELARRYSVDRQTIKKIVENKTYKN
jgi:plasmid maintenance system antidote protein VapI